MVKHTIKVIIYQHQGDSYLALIWLKPECYSEEDNLVLTSIKLSLRQNVILWQQMKVIFDTETGMEELVEIFESAVQDLEEVAG